MMCAYFIVITKNKYRKKNQQQLMFVVAMKLQNVTFRFQIEHTQIVNTSFSVNFFIFFLLSSYALSTEQLEYKWQMFSWQ